MHAETPQITLDMLTLVVLEEAEALVVMVEHLSA
jgi:hypothetical protein